MTSYHATTRTAPRSSPPDDAAAADRVQPLAGASPGAVSIVTGDVAELLAVDEPDLGARPRAAVVLGASLVAGVLANLLLRGGLPSVGFTLAVVSLLTALQVVRRRASQGTTVGTMVLSVTALWFAGAMSWRTSDALIVLNGFALLTTLIALVISSARGTTLDVAGAGVAAYLLAARAAVVAVLKNGARVVGLANAERDGDSQMNRMPAVLRGIVIAVPVLLVFGMLLTSADASFARIVSSLIAFELSDVFGHVAASSILAFIATGYIGTATRVAPLPSEQPSTVAPALGIVEVTIVLGAVDALFAAFVAVQLGYLFGGATHVTTTAGVTYAEYARRGFFELVMVTGLSVPLLLGARALLARGSSRELRRYRGLALTMLALLGVIVASAIARMRLYQGAYGLTEDRFFAMAIICWLALVLAWFAATVLRERAAPFALGTLVSGWVTIVLLTVVNPEAWIAREQLGRAIDGRRFEASSVGLLGHDAMPAIAAMLPRVPHAPRCQVADQLDGRFPSAADAQRAVSWREWNIGASRSRAILARRGATALNAGCFGADGRALYPARPSLAPRPPAPGSSPAVRTTVPAQS